MYVLWISLFTLYDQRKTQIIEINSSIETTSREKYLWTKDRGEKIICRTKTTGERYCGPTTTCENLEQIRKKEKCERRKFGEPRPQENIFGRAKTKGEN